MGSEAKPSCSQSQTGFGVRRGGLMPVNKPMIVRPVRPKLVVTSDETQLRLRECSKCGTKFYIKEELLEIERSKSCSLWTP
jgi:hypothetical protein